MGARFGNIRSPRSVELRSKRMNATLPYLFFFSHSRADWENDAFLAKFFADLEKKVAIVAGAGNRKIGFRDEEGVKTGDDWTRKISAAVAGELSRSVKAAMPDRQPRSGQWRYGRTLYTTSCSRACWTTFRPKSVFGPTSVTGA